MALYPFRQVDVFSTKGYAGNPLAVFLDADGLNSTQMQQIAKWTNLSETTFIQKPTIPGADYRIRIFTPGCELPFAGHPTIGSCFVLLDNKSCSAKKNKVVQQCNSGLVELTLHNEDVNQTWISFKLPSYKTSSISPEVIVDLEKSLNLCEGSCSQCNTPFCVDVGPRNAIIQLPNGADVLNLNPNFQAIFECCSKNFVDWRPNFWNV